MSRAIGRTLMTLALALLPSVAGAGGAWSLGTHVGFSSLRSGSNGGSSTIAALPGNAFAYQPAFRLSFGSGRRLNEAILDLGAIWIDEGGSSLALTVGSLGYQHVFLETSYLAPFLNASFGLVRQSGDALTTTTKTFGGGIGVRHVVHDDRGAPRIEVRGDFLGANQDLGQPDLSLWTLRAGFDLWL